MKSLQTDKHTFVYLLGPDLQEGPLPTCFYFSLGGKESLTLKPYNRPAVRLAKLGVRVVSFDLPFHGPNFDKLKAMEAWAKAFASGDDILSPFFKQTLEAIDWLIDQEIVDAKHMATAGLSRGGFIATHIAALHHKIKTVLAYAPLTSLTKTTSFINTDIDAVTAELCHCFDLTAQLDALMHLEKLRFYIGNRDTRVSTDACYQFIRHLADKGHTNRNWHLSAELFIGQSIGFMGHGTAEATFDAGADWLKEALCTTQ